MPKVIFSGDFFRYNRMNKKCQDINIEWFFHLISPAVKYTTNVIPTSLQSSNDITFISDRIYEIENLSKDFLGWTALFERNLSARSLSLIADYFEDAFVIGFELPEFLVKAFNFLNINYIDFTIHPARFADDLIFGFRTNLHLSPCDFLAHLVDEDELYFHAGLAKATLSRLPKLNLCKDSTDVVLFAGQTDDDKVLIKNGKMLCIDQTFEHLAKICDTHEHVLVKPHPFCQDNKIITALTRLFSNTHIVQDNFYYLMAQEQVSTVYSLTSSTSVESAYFGKKGVHIFDYPYFFSVDSISPSNYFSVRSSFIQPSFWVSVFGSTDFDVINRKDFPLANIRSRLRKNIRSFWGADILE